MTPAAIMTLLSDRDPAAQVDVRVDPHTVGDRHAVGDVGLLPDDALGGR